MPAALEKLSDRRERRTDASRNRTLLLLANVFGWQFFYSRRYADFAMPRNINVARQQP